MSTDHDPLFRFDRWRANLRVREIYNDHRVHRAIAGLTPAQFAGAPSPAPDALEHYGWQQHCRGLFEIPVAA